MDQHSNRTTEKESRIEGEARGIHRRENNDTGLQVFCASLSTAPLQSAVLALAVIAQASPARAASLILNCESTGDDPAKQFRIDFDNQTVQAINSSPERNPPVRAEITEMLIEWKTIIKLPELDGRLSDYEIEGSINRLAGSIYWTMKYLVPRRSKWNRPAVESGDGALHADEIAAWRAVGWSRRMCSRWGLV